MTTTGLQGYFAASMIRLGAACGADLSATAADVCALAGLDIADLPDPATLTVETVTRWGGLVEAAIAKTDPSQLQQHLEEQIDAFFDEGVRKGEWIPVGDGVHYRRAQGDPR